MSYRNLGGTHASKKHGLLGGPPRKFVFTSSDSEVTFKAISDFDCQLHVGVSCAN